jgi:hypothetical protein
VDPTRLLIVRPKTAEQLAWSAVQLVRSGAFACVVLDLTRGPKGTGGVRLSPAEGKRLMDAAVRGGSLLLLLTAPEAPADGMMRLRTEARGESGLSVEVVRSRQGGLGTRSLVPWESLYPELSGWETPWGAELPPPEDLTVPELRPHLEAGSALH